MRNRLWTKGLVFGILLLMVEANFLLLLSGGSNSQRDKSLDQESTEICTMDTSVFSSMMNTRFVSRDPSVKADGAYTKRLVGEYNYRHFRDAEVRYFGNTTLITQPMNNDIYRATDLISIIGTVTGPEFLYYSIHWGIGENPSEWFATGITLKNGGLLPLVNETLAIWNTSFVVEDDFFTLRLTVNFGTNQSEIFIKNIYIDPSLKEGWPQKINFQYVEDPGGSYYYWIGNLEPVICDINHDGDGEIIFYVGGNPTKIYVFTQEGRSLDGWPVEVDGEDLPGGNLASPSVGDINNDGDLEICVNGMEGLYVYDHHGSLLPFIPLRFSSQPTSETVLADVNTDDNLEIIKKFDPSYESPYFGGGEKIAVLDSNGKMFENWPQCYYNTTGPDGESYVFWIIGFSSTPAIGNFDNDPEQEIVVATPRNVFDDPTNPHETWHIEGNVSVFNLDGTVLPGFPVRLDGWIASSPAIGDLNNDGYDEITVGTMKDKDPKSGLYVLDRFGNNVTGFPQLLGESIYTSPAIADFNNDHFLEIVVSTVGFAFKTYIFNYSGAVLPGWPQNTTWADYRSPLVGDITGDMIPEILTTAGNGFSGGGVYAWDVHGILLDGFPKVTEVDAQASATITDIDADGKVELIASSDWDFDLETQQDKFRGSIYVWDVDTLYTPETMHWPTYHHDPQHTGMYPLVPRIVTIGNITGGVFTVKATVKNIGVVTATNIAWTITVTGGMILFGKTTTGSIEALNPAEEQMITSRLIIGFGKTLLKLIVTYPGNTTSREQKAIILVFFIISK